MNHEQEKSDDEDRMRRGPWHYHGRGNTRFVLITIALVAGSYAFNRAVLLGLHPFFRNHFDDLLAGVLILAIADVLPAQSTPLARTIRHPLTRLLIVGGAAFSWEVIAPLVLPWSHADPLDALANACGALGYILAEKMTQKRHYRACVTTHRTTSTRRR